MTEQTTDHADDLAATSPDPGESHGLADLDDADAPQELAPVVEEDGSQLEALQAVREAEAAGQRAVCNVPDGELPEDLAAALDRRVEVNLAATGGHPVQSCAGADQEVRRLEKPWRIDPVEEASA